MEDLVDLIATDASASDISDKIKERLYAKAAEYVDATRPIVGAELLVMKHQRRNLKLKLKMKLL